MKLLRRISKTNKTGTKKKNKIKEKRSIEDGE
jgi:hypothetical protein